MNERSKVGYTYYPAGAVVLLLKEFQMEPFFILVPCVSTENFEIETFPAQKCSNKIDYNYLFSIPFQDFFFSKEKSLYPYDIVPRKCVIRFQFACQYGYYLSAVACGFNSLANFIKEEFA